jgi:hypothetical protein
LSERGREREARTIATAGQPPAKDERFTLRVDARTLELWRPFARAEDVSVSALVTVAVEHYRVRSQLRHARNESATSARVRA